MKCEVPSWPLAGLVRPGPSICRRQPADIGRVAASMPDLAISIARSGSFRRIGRKLAARSKSRSGHRGRGARRSMPRRGSGRASPGPRRMAIPEQINAGLLLAIRMRSFASAPHAARNRLSGHGPAGVIRSWRVNIRQGSQVVRSRKTWGSRSFGSGHLERVYGTPPASLTSAPQSPAAPSPRRRLAGAGHPNREPQGAPTGLPGPISPFHSPRQTSSWLRFSKRFSG